MTESFVPEIGWPDADGDIRLDDDANGRMQFLVYGIANIPVEALPKAVVHRWEVISPASEGHIRVRKGSAHMTEVGLQSKKVDAGHGHVRFDNYRIVSLNVGGITLADSEGIEDEYTYSKYVRVLDRKLKECDRLATLIRAGTIINFVVRADSPKVIEAIQIVAEVVASDQPKVLYEGDTQDGGRIVLSRWPEGHTLRYNGETVWKSWQ